MTKEKDSVCTSCQPEHEPQITPLCVNSFAESFGPVLLKPTDAAAQPINESLQQFEMANTQGAIATLTTAVESGDTLYEAIPRGGTKTNKRTFRVLPISLAHRGERA